MKSETLETEISQKPNFKIKPSHRKKVVWISFLYLDRRLDKTSRIEILGCLAKLGYDVSLLVVQSQKKYQSKDSHVDIIQIPLRYVPVISPIFFGLITLFFLPFYIIRKKPDFIIVEPSIAILGFMWKPLLSKLIRFKVVLDIRTTPVGIFGFRGYLKILQFNISVHMAKLMFDGITIITPMMKKEICKNYNIDPESVGVRSDGVSTSLFTYEKHIYDGSELRKKLGLSDKFIVLYHGELGRTRGVIETANAIKITRRKHPDIVLFLLGKGPAVPILQKLIQKNGLKDKVILYDPVDYYDVPKYIAMSDLGIVPLPDISDWRNQCPLKLLEYLAMKRTVIVTDIPANREIVGDKECGIYVSSCDPIEIARAMVFAYNNKEKLKEWGELGRTIVVQKYNWYKVAKDLEDYLSRINARLVKC